MRGAPAGEGGGGWLVRSFGVGLGVVTVDGCGRLAAPGRGRLAAPGCGRLAAPPTTARDTRPWVPWPMPPRVARAAGVVFRRPRVTVVACTCNMHNMYMCMDMCSQTQTGVTACVDRAETAWDTRQAR